MQRPKDILSQPYHIQEYINYLERKNSSLHNAKQYALDLFEQYLDGEKTIAKISQELKRE